MYERCFEGLTISPAAALTLLEGVIERFCEIVLETPPRAGHDLALGALGYFMGARDLIVDSAPGGLGDDLTIAVMALREIEPEGPVALPSLELGPASQTATAPEMAELREKLLKVAVRLSPSVVVQHAREKLAQIRADLGPSLAAGGDAAGSGPDRFAAAKLYMGMVMAAMWVSRPRPGPARTKKKTQGFARAPKAAWRQQPPPSPVPEDESAWASRNPWEPSGAAGRAQRFGVAALLPVAMLACVFLAGYVLGHARLAGVLSPLFP